MAATGVVEAHILSVRTKSIKQLNKYLLFNKYLKNFLQNLEDTIMFIYSCKKVKVIRTKEPHWIDVGEQSISYKMLWSF